ncbi:hypothetical protein D9M72_427980 [compost metagenome]
MLPIRMMIVEASARIMSTDESSRMFTALPTVRNSGDMIVNPMIMTINAPTGARMLRFLLAQSPKPGRVDEGAGPCAAGFLVVVNC